MCHMHACAACVCSSAPDLAEEELVEGGGGEVADHAAGGVPEVGATGHHRQLRHEVERADRALRRRERGGARHQH